MTYVLDSSAVLAFILSERGAEAVGECLPGAAISSVNLAEVVSVLCDRGWDDDGVRRMLAHLALECVGFDQDQAERAGLLRRPTRHLGLSLGDRACLALAAALNLPALTADARMAEFSDGVSVRLVR